MVGIFKNLLIIKAGLFLPFSVLPTSIHHTAVRRSLLRLDGVSTISHFMLPITMRCMVETQYAAAGCRSTASLLYTSYVILHTSYHALHGGDAVRRSRLRLYGVSTISSYFIRHTSYFVPPCVAWWRRSTPQQAASLQFHTSCFLSPCVAWRFAIRRSDSGRCCGGTYNARYNVHKTPPQHSWC